MNDSFELIDFLGDGCHGIRSDAENGEEEENAAESAVLGFPQVEHLSKTEMGLWGQGRFVRILLENVGIKKRSIIIVCPLI